MPPSSTMRESKLLQLPLEIREGIYRHLFSGAKAYVKLTLRSGYESDSSDDSHRQTQEDTRCHPQVFLVCKKIYQEAQPIQAALIHLHFNYASSVKNISSEWQSKYLGSVKQVTVNFWCRKFDHKDFPSLEYLNVAAIPRTACTWNVRSTVKKVQRNLLLGSMTRTWQEQRGSVACRLGPLVGSRGPSKIHSVASR